jgi:iron complex outermembrane recepter protein
MFMKQRLLVLTLGVLVISAPSALAQTATAKSADASPSSEEVVTLSPFEVASSEVHGYQASESVTGTRIATKIVETPFAVDVVTQDFINDFMAFDLNSQLAFVPSFSPSEVFGSFQLRGFTSPVVFVDGFKRVGLVDTVDISRIEVIKGSAGSIYGAIQPGGAVNIITLKPTLTPSHDLVIGAGSDSFYRAALFTSGPIGDTKAYYRVDASTMYTEYGEDFASRKQGYVSAKLLYQPDPDTSVSIDLEHSELAEHPFNQALTITEKQTMPWAGNSVTESQYYGMVSGSLLNYDYAGPESVNHNRVSSATLSVEKKINDVWNLRFGANIFNNPYSDQLIGSGAFYPYGTGNVTVVNGVVTNAYTPEVKDQPQADFKPQKGGGMQLDNVFQFTTGSVKNRLLLTADYYTVNQRTITLAPTVNGSQATDYYALYSPYDPSGASYYTMQATWSSALGYGWNTTTYGQNPSLYNFPINDNWTDSQDAGVFASYWATLFHDRLTLMAGGRADRVRNDVANYNISSAGVVTTAANPTEPSLYQTFSYIASAKTYQLGASFKVTDGINIYANKSSAFNPQPQLDSYTGLPLPNNKSNGYEYGIKGANLGGRLTWSLDHFLINQYNVVQSETDPITGVKDTILSGQQQAKGYEAEFQYQVTPSFQVLGAWGYSPTTILKSETLTFLNNLPARRVPRDNAGLAGRYEFRHGLLKGFYAIADVKYLSKSLVNLGSGKSLIPGPAGATLGSTISMYYVPSQNKTYLKDPKITGEDKVTATPVINVPFPGNSLLPYPNVAANAVINYPVDVNGNPLPVLSGTGTSTVYAGQPTGVFVDDGREYNYNPESAVFDVGFGYTWHLAKTTNSLKVTLKNILDRKYTWGSGIPGMPFQMFATYDIHF